MSTFTKLFIIIAGSFLFCCVGVMTYGLFFPEKMALPIVTFTPSPVVVIVQPTTGPSQPLILSSAPTAIPEQAETAVPVDEPAPTNTPEPTTTTADGSSRALAAPLGSEVEVGDMLISVIGVERPADDIIAAGNEFNEEAEPGNEFVMITVSVTCVRDSSEICLLSPFSFELSGSAGIIRDIHLFVAGVNGQLEDTEFFGGATVSGWVVYEIEQGETDLILSYETLFDDGYLLVGE